MAFDDSFILHARTDVDFPPPNEHGVLRSGEHASTFLAMCHSSFVLGPFEWNAGDLALMAARRRYTLLKDAKQVVERLWQAGVEPVYLGGPLLQTVLYPSHVTLYFTCPYPAFANGFEPFSALERIDPALWHGGPLKAMDMLRAKYSINLLYEVEGFESGLKDTLTQTRAGVPIGIVRLMPDDTDKVKGCLACAAGQTDQR